MSNNPYTRAADAYGQTEKKSAEVDQRILEGQALIKAARLLEDVQKKYRAGEKVTVHELDDVLTYNKRLWTIFVSDAADDSHNIPQQLKNNIANIGMFIFKRTLDIQMSPTAEKFEAMIDINRNIAAGLLQTPKEAGAQGSSAKQPQQPQQQPAPVHEKA